MSVDEDSPARMTANVLAFSVDALLGHKPKGQSNSPGKDDRCKSKWFPSPNPYSSRSSSPRLSVHGSSSPCSGQSECYIPRVPSTNFSNITNLSSQNEEIQLELCGKELWSEFHRIGNEMIITKAGRRMFPALKLKVSGLDPEGHYIFWVDVVSLDDNRYRYVYPSSQWMVAGTGDPPMPFNTYTHSDSPSMGRHWMMQFISFDRLKLTNNKQPGVKGQVSLHSMHKYQPRVHIQRTNDLLTDPELQIDEKKSVTFAFPETAFITVTAYQNQQITRLKIASNPFAKGFRDTVRSRDDSDQFEQSRFLAGRPHFGFPGIPSFLYPPTSIPTYPYLISATPTLCNPPFFPYCFLDGCPTTSGSLFNGSLSGSLLTTSAAMTDNFIRGKSETRATCSGLLSSDIKREPVSPISPYRTQTQPTVYLDYGEPSNSPPTNNFMYHNHHVRVVDNEKTSES